MRKIDLARRYLLFTTALLVSAFGVSLITRSVLGTSPISSVPYVLSLNTPLSMGTYVFFLNMVLIVGQMLMLGRKGILREKINLLMQLPVSVLFGFFIDLSMAFLSSYQPELYGLKLTSLTLGCAVLAIGICMEVIADVTMVSGEFFVSIASKRFQWDFGKVKIGFDCSLIMLALLTSWLMAGRLDGVREGTVLAALLTGPFVRLFMSPTRWSARRANSVLTQTIEVFS